MRIYSMDLTIVVMSPAPFLSGARAGESPPRPREDLQVLQMQRRGQPRGEPIFAQICHTSSRRAS
jgi:hypothetical protein